LPVATEEVQLDEQQRIFGVIPNFYVSYDQNAAPLTAKYPSFKLPKFWNFLRFCYFDGARFDRRRVAALGGLQKSGDNSKTG